MTRAHPTNLLGALSVACGDLQRDVLEAHGLDTGTGAALLCAHTRPGSTIGEIACTARLTHSGAVRAASRLEELGLVQRRHGHDRRTVEIFCAKSGTVLARKLLKARRQALEVVSRRLSAVELRQFDELAAKLLSEIPSTRADAWRICRLCEHAVCKGDHCPVGSAVK